MGKLTCTIIRKKKNRSLYTTGVPKGFTERYWKYLWIAKWILSYVEDEVREVFEDCLLKKKDLPEKYEYLIEDFDKKFRILVTDK